jgi:hypothetical protein
MIRLGIRFAKSLLRGEIQFKLEIKAGNIHTLAGAARTEFNMKKNV